MASNSDFLVRWAKSEAAERANYQLFLWELCDFLEVPRRDPAVADDSKNLYVFERSVASRHRDGTTSVGRIDLYKHKCFVLEAKQGSEQTAQQGTLLEAAPRLRRVKWTTSALTTIHPGSRRVIQSEVVFGNPPDVNIPQIGVSTLACLKNRGT